MVVYLLDMERNTMTVYRVNIWTMYEVEADNAEQAKELAREAFEGGLIKNRHMEYDEPEVTDHDEPCNY